MPTHRQTAHPARGPGHYSVDRNRWWDEHEQQWLQLGDTSDTLEIELEDAGGESWIASILTVLGSQNSSGYYRFVGVARSADPRWPTYRTLGDTFPAPRGFLLDVPPEEAWAPGMTRSLLNLRSKLLREGWTLTGHGEHPWSGRYVRACVAGHGASADQPGHRHFRRTSAAPQGPPDTDQRRAGRP